jgi:hypothetical protein
MIDAGLLKSDQTGRIHEAGRVKLALSGCTKELTSPFQSVFPENF